jgi:hypothetical protein
MLAPDAISAGPSEATAGFEVALRPSVNVGNPLANGSLGASTRAGMRRKIAGQRGGAGWTRTSDRRIMSSEEAQPPAEMAEGPGQALHSAPIDSYGLAFIPMRVAAFLPARGGGLHLENYAQRCAG